MFSLKTLGKPTLFGSKLWRNLRQTSFGMMLAFALAACANLQTAPSARAQITAYHQWKSTQSKTFRFQTTPERAASLAYQAQVQAVKTSLLRWGFEESIDPKTASLQIDFAVSSSSKTVQWIQPTPYPGFYGSYGSAWGRDRFWGFSHPLYASAQSAQVLQGQFNLTISDAQGARLYEASLQAAMREPALIHYIPTWVDGLMQHFPGESGAVRSLTIPLPALAP